VPTKREQFQHSIRARYLGERMRSLREERGLTLKYIAAFLGVEFSTLARYERAEWPFRADHVTALLDVYGVYGERQREELGSTSSRSSTTGGSSPGPRSCASTRPPWCRRCCAPATTPRR
jgi:ribosome-binding protein aMBF1 (putative translation factor)